MKNTLLATGTVIGVLLPQLAFGYITPEEVLLNRELYLPPTAREAQIRTDIQAEESAARRTAEQEDNKNAQKPAAPEEEVITEPELHESAPDAESNLSAEDRELLQTLRLLTRVKDNQEDTKLQQQILYLTGQSLHSGAPLQPLAPTGAGTALGVTTAVGAVIWTLWKARRSEKATIVQ